MTPPINGLSPLPTPAVNESRRPVWQRLVETHRKHLPAEHFSGINIVLAVSGGADSVAMLRIMFDVWTQSDRFNPDHLCVAHFNHQLRGDASDDDQRFVSELAESLHLRCLCGQATRQPLPSDSQLESCRGEAEFRAERYRFLQATAESVGARYVMVAHTADDNVETMLHHLFRGSGISGLAGIATHRPLGAETMLHRPLLSMRRDDLRSGLSEIGQTWREDSSNAEDRFQRNWIRNTLLPIIRQRYPQADEALLRTIQNHTDIRDKLEVEASKWIANQVQLSADEVVIQRGDIDLASLSAVVRSVWTRMNWPRQSINAAHHRQLQAVIAGDVDESFTLPGDVQCRVSKERITLRVRNGKLAGNHA